MANTSPTANNAHLEPEDDDWTDNDSGLGGASIASSTTSLASSILQHRKENGRTYHAYKEGKYALPNDKGENDRLDHMYHLVTLTLDNKLCLAPIEKTKVHRVLDVGTGTGIWAIDFADDHPEAEVLGIDLSPIQPLFVPPNVTFQVDDLEEPWTFSHKFDFIHSRMMTGSFSDWPRFLEQSFANLNPGGFIELCDSIQPITADDDSFPPDSAIVKWSTLVCDAMIKFGRPLNSALWHKERLAKAGFVDIVQKEYKWPINPWPKDKKAKELGLWTRENYLGGLFGLSVFVFTNLLGWTIEELKILIADVKKEFMDTKIHGYLSLWVVYAQKPAS